MEGWRLEESVESPGAATAKSTRPSDVQILEFVSGNLGFQHFPELGRHSLIFTFKE